MIERFPTPAALAAGVARHIVARASGATAGGGRFTIALSGGSTPRDVYGLLATEEFAGRVEWGLVHVFWSDERCVPPDDARSNYRMAKETLLDRVPIPGHQIHRIRGEDDPERAARAYEDELRALLDGGLDLALLGMGEDGHTASLFPGQTALLETACWVVTAQAPEGAIRRITLTPALLNASRHVTFMVSGAGKAARLEQVLQGPFIPGLLPAQAIRPGSGRLTWMIDEAAAGRLPGRYCGST